MGQDISKGLNPPPLTLQYCVVDGSIDILRYKCYKRRCDDYDKSIGMLRMRALKKRKLADIEMSKPKKRAKKRSVKRHKLIVRDNDGTLREIRPTDTLWYLLYVNQPPLNERLLRLFRTRFRMPYESFISLSEEIMVHSCFVRWTRCDAVGQSPSNIKLLILGCMRYIGRAWTLDDLCEANGISINVNWDFLLCFIEYGSTILYKKWVFDPNLNTIC